jgi:GDP-L-fucose synthase
MNTGPALVVGARTVGGRAIKAALEARGVRVFSDASGDLDPCDGAALRRLFREQSPTTVIHAGFYEAGIAGNLARPASLMADNLLAQLQVLGAAQRAGVERLLYLGSACGYPRSCPQPMRPSQLFSGPVEPSSAPYALARLAGLVQCSAVRTEHGLPWISAVPANIFGPGDDIDPRDAHVVGALMRRCWQARRDGDDEVVVWGSGEAQRDFLFAPDLAEACLFLLDHYEGEQPVNIGSGQGTSIATLARAIAEVTGFEGRLRFDATKPGGAPVKLLDSGALEAMGWRAPTPLTRALEISWSWVKAQLEGAKP